MGATTYEEHSDWAWPDDRRHDPEHTRNDHGGVRGRLPDVGRSVAQFRQAVTAASEAVSVRDDAGYVDGRDNTEAQDGQDQLRRSDRGGV